MHSETSPQNSARPSSRARWLLRLAEWLSVRFHWYPAEEHDGFESDLHRRHRHDRIGYTRRER